MRRILHAALFTLATLGAAAAGAQGYTLTDLGASTYPSAINTSGQVTGSVGTRAFVWQAGHFIDLGTLGGEYSVGLAINDAGQVAGYSTKADGHYRAFLWSGGTMSDLGTLGADYSAGYAIDSLGRVGGSSMTADGRSHAFVWSAGTMRDLGTLGGDQPGWTTTAQGLNAAGQVVGYSYIASGDFRAFRMAGGPMQDMGTLGGDWSQAYAINASGTITGQAYVPHNIVAHAFTSRGGAMTDLGALYQYSSGLAINGHGVVVGSANVRSRGTLMVYHAVVFTKTGPVDLNGALPRGSGWVLSEASGINDAGQIVGYGRVNGVDHGFVLTPK